MDEVISMEAKAELPATQLPTRVTVDEIHALSVGELVQRFQNLGLKANPERTRHQLVFDLLKVYTLRGVPLFAEGILDAANESQAVLRWPRFNFLNCPENVYVPVAILKKFGLKSGVKIAAMVRHPRDREKNLVVQEVLSIEDIPAESWTVPKNFDQLTPMFPNQRIILENLATKSVSARAVDLVAPLGFGQRALIVAPPRTGKTILLKEFANAIRANTPNTRVLLLLVDERPEEVTDFRRTVDAEIFASTFDEPPTRHVQVAELVIERAKRLVELGKDVVILLDSLTRLARGYNNLQPGKGRIMSGGVEAKALAKPKKFFSSARNVEEGGSLTIVATALVETESRMDEVIFEEFKGTGNMELHLDRSLVEKRVFPALNILLSATRRDELLFHPQEFDLVQVMRKTLAQLPALEATEVLLKNIRATQSNTELLLAGIR
jgi:transcription termination factor Rho